MKRILKWIAIVIAILIVLVLILPFVINVNTFRPKIESELTNALGRKVSVGNLSLSLWSGSLAADNISIADDPSFGNTPFVRADALKVGVNLIPLVFSKSLQVRDITLTRPQVSLLRTPAGKWNFSSLGTTPSEPGARAPATPAQPAGKAPAKAPEAKPSPKGNETAPPAAVEGGKSESEQGLEQNLSVEQLNIRGGQISIADTNAPAKAHVYRNVDLTLKNFSFTSQFPFTLTADLPGGGNAKLDGQGGPINRADTSLTPLEAKISVNQLDLAKSGFLDPSSGIAGLANFAGTIASDGTRARSSGDATAEKLKLSPKGTPAPRPVNLKYSTTYELEKQVGQLTGDVSVVKAVAKLNGAYDLRPQTAVLNLKLNADNMPVDDLATLLPALGVTLPRGSSLQGGTLSADFAINGPVDKMVIAGPVKLVNTKLSGFDMASKLSAISALGGGAQSGPDTTIQNFSSNVRYSPSGVETSNVNLVIPSLGTLTGNGSVSPQNALDYKMMATLNGSVVGGLSKIAGVSGSSGSIPFFIQGTASDPRFVPDVKGVLNSQLKQRLGSQIPGGQNSQGLVDSITGLLGKKKK
jgi:AsmA protein